MILPKNEMVEHSARSKKASMHDRVISISNTNGLFDRVECLSQSE